jgi:hypothetical protein
MTTRLELKMNLKDYFIAQVLTCSAWLPRQMILSSLLFHPQFLAWTQPESSEDLMTRYQRAVDKHLTGRLRDIAQGHRPTDVDMCMLVRTLKTDVAQTAIIPITKKNSA